MSFQPVLPLTGYAGWSFLKKTVARQQVAQQSVPAQVRDEAYFRDRIGKVKTAEQLVGDKRLLRIALTAFGLEGDVNSKAFIQKILEEGTLTVGSLANKLADKQYQKLSAAFGFGDYSVPRTAISTFPDEILTQFKARSFETAVGAQNNSYRLAMNAEREIPALAAKTTSETSRWYSILGNAPLREVMQTAFGLPSSFAAIDLDQQVAVMKEKARTTFGQDSVSQFSEPAKLEALVRRFLLRSEMQDLGAGNSPAAIALTLLRR
jgi:Protein of unknown function (DUF1217)